MKGMCLLFLSSAIAAVAAQSQALEELRVLVERNLQSVSLRTTADLKVRPDQVKITASVTSKGRDLPETIEKNRQSRTALETALVAGGLVSSNIVYQPFSFDTQSGFFSGKSYELTSRVEITVTNEAQFAAVVGVIWTRRDEWKFLNYLTVDSRSEEHEETVLRKALTKIKRRKELFESELNLVLTPIRFGEHTYQSMGGGGLGGAGVTAGAPVLNAQGNPIAQSPAVTSSPDAFGQNRYDVELSVTYATKSLE